MLLRAHKVFIVVCTLFALLFAGLQFRAYLLEHQNAQLVRGILSGVGAVALVLYFIYLLREGEIMMRKQSRVLIEEEKANKTEAL